MPLVSHLQPTLQESASDERAHASQAQEALFHDVLMRSLEELLSSESVASTGADTNVSAQALPTLQVSPATSSYSMHSTIRQLPPTTLHMLAASHLEFLASQQQQQQLQQQQLHLHQHQHQHQSISTQARSAGSPTAAVSFAPDPASGWAGHRVLALPGSDYMPVTLQQHGNLSLDSLLPAVQSPYNAHHALAELANSTLDGLSMQRQHSPQQPASWSALSAAPSSMGNMGVPCVNHNTDTGRSLSSGLLGPGPHHGGDVARGRQLYGYKGRQYAGTRQYAGSAAGPTQVVRVTTVRGAAPAWAGPDWDPMRDVQELTKARASGTGVFLPQGGDDDAFPRQQLQQQQSPRVV